MSVRLFFDSSEMITSVFEYEHCSILPIEMSMLHYFECFYMLRCVNYTLLILIHEKLLGNRRCVNNKNKISSLLRCDVAVIWLIRSIMALQKNGSILSNSLQLDEICKDMTRICWIFFE